MFSWKGVDTVYLRRYLRRKMVNVITWRVSWDQDWSMDMYGRVARANRMTSKSCFGRCWDVRLLGSGGAQKLLRIFWCTPAIWDNSEIRLNYSLAEEREECFARVRTAVCIWWLVFFLGKHSVFRATKNVSHRKTFFDDILMPPFAVFTTTFQSRNNIGHRRSSSSSSSSVSDSGRR